MPQQHSLAASRNVSHPIRPSAPSVIPSTTTQSPPQSQKEGAGGLSTHSNPAVNTPNPQHTQQLLQHQSLQQQHSISQPSLNHVSMNPAGNLNQQFQNLNIGGVGGVTSSRGGQLVAGGSTSNSGMPELDPSVVRRSHSFTSASLQQKAQMQGMGQSMLQQ